MSCKLGDKCDNVFACNILRPNVELLGCNFYKPKKPMTNEEYLRSLNTEQLAEAITDIVYECRDSDDCMDCRLGWCSKDCVVEWLKQPHTPKE